MWYVRNMADSVQPLQLFMGGDMQMRRILALGIILVSLLMVLSACGAGVGQGEGYRRITAEEAKAMMDKGNVRIVDVRTQAEYDEGHIEGAILLPNEDIPGREAEVLPDKEETLLVYCRSGRRSREAGEKLAGLGYKHVNDFGGINDWTYGTVK